MRSSHRVSDLLLLLASSTALQLPVGLIGCAPQFACPLRCTKLHRVVPCQRRLKPDRDFRFGLLRVGGLLRMWCRRPFTSETRRSDVDLAHRPSNRCSIEPPRPPDDSRPVPRSRKRIAAGCVVAVHSASTPDRAVAFPTDTHTITAHEIGPSTVGTTSVRGGRHRP